MDDKLGGRSATIMQRLPFLVFFFLYDTVCTYRAIRRIYGEAASKVIDSMQKNPTLAVQRVLQRLKQKEVFRLINYCEKF